VLVNYVSVVVNAVNIALTLALTFYTLRIQRLFKGGLLSKTRLIFFWAAFFLFLAAVFRAALVWGRFTADLEPLELGATTVGLILLFAFAFFYARVLASFRNEFNSR
jgi:hypothetical protein